MSILFIGKRFYTNRDAYTEKFGRIYQLPYYWSKELNTKLWLIDYHSKEKIKDQHESLKIESTPVFSFMMIINIIKVLLIDRPKTIVASGDCYIGLMSFLLAKLCRAKFIFDVYDKYDAFSGYRNLGFKNLFKLLLKKSDVCLFASKKLKNDNNDICNKTLLVPNGIDINHFYPRNKNESRSIFNLDQNLIYIGYFGSMEVERGIDDLISAVKLLHDENKSIYILLGGKKREDLNVGYEFIHYLGNLPFHEVPIAMACCDLLTLPYRNSPFLDHASSCKIGEYAAMNIPIVTTNSNHVLNNYKFNERDLSYISQSCNPNDLIKTIKKNLVEKHKFDIAFSTWNDISKNII